MLLKIFYQTPKSPPPPPLAVLYIRYKLYKSSL